MNPAEEEGELPDLDALVVAARTADATTRRRRDRWRAARRVESHDVDDLLLGAVGERLVLHVAGGAELTGRLEAVGNDLVQLDLGHGRCWLALDAIDAVRLASPRPGDRADRDTATFADVLEDLAAERAEVVAALRSGATIAGELVSGGRSLQLRRHDRGDVVVIRPSALASVMRRSRVSR